MEKTNEIEHIPKISLSVNVVTGKAVGTFKEYKEKIKDRIYNLQYLIDTDKIRLEYAKKDMEREIQAVKNKYTEMKDELIGDIVNKKIVISQLKKPVNEEDFENDKEHSEKEFLEHYKEHPDFYNNMYKGDEK